MAIDEGRLRTVISDLKSAGVSLSDIEKEVTLRNKWGKRQHPAMSAFTTEDLADAIMNWMRF